jgi:D-alanine-D-alanine ligase
MQKMKYDAQNKAKIASQLGKMAVLYGGLSAEREISLQSGNAVLQALIGAGVDAFGIDITKNAVNQLQQSGADTVFIALHGAGGEDGSMQALLEFLRLPYTGSGVMASALCMDKLRTKHLWRGVGLSTPEYAVLTPDCNWEATLGQLGGVAFVKPVHEGSSIGMTVASTPAELEQAYTKAAEFDQSVLAERCIRGAEYTVAILNGETLPPIKLETDHVFYDYDAKYLADDTRYLCPCGLPEAKEKELRDLALRAFDVIGCRGWGRADVMADEQGNFYLLEVNTVPGMTSHSLVPMAAQAASCSFDDLVLAIASQALKVQEAV